MYKSSIVVPRAEDKVIRVDPKIMTASIFQSDGITYLSDQAGEYEEWYPTTRENLLIAIKQHKDFLLELETLLEQTR
jgi:hypothetical protein